VAELHVEVVAPDRQVWSGEAAMVIARTEDGELGILPGHIPLLSMLTSGPVTIRTLDGQEIVTTVHGGFLSVSGDNVSILAEDIDQQALL